MRSLALAALLSVFAFGAQAAPVNVPIFTLTGPVSTGTVCTPTAAASGPASAAPAGTVMFTCIVSPVGWIGTVAPLVPPNLVVTGLTVPSTATTTTFSLALAAAGVAQTYPASTSTTTP